MPATESGTRTFFTTCSRARSMSTSWMALRPRILSERAEVTATRGTASSRADWRAVARLVPPGPGTVKTVPVRPETLA
ncbi:MAG: hypothetical protein A3I72_13265 [Candidatus Tectomicrobia bacterium RIFCSPLOWO2_02_FULL_70_19]|nr:MAG: hypothetical protein A3I72_13265 [Candidatus Tectomicrobia bacterium RIFCSPLOWO2_02_FULL_70_19]